MVSGIFTKAVVVIPALFAILAVAPALAARQSSTVWAGVYTAAQAERGHTVYKDHCIYCHHADLLGGEDLPVVPPALVGFGFEERFQGKSVAFLFRAIADTMPWGRSRLKSPQLYADVVAYLLKENDYPAGPNELPADPSELDQILITGKP